MTPKHIDRIARRKAGSPEGWAWCRMEWIGKGAGADLLIEWGVPTRVYASGAWKGHPDWRKVPTSRVIVTGAEIDAERRDFEARTGLCGGCEGDGQTFESWSKAEGVKHRPCPDCGGTGRAKGAGVEAATPPGPR